MVRARTGRARDEFEDFGGIAFTLDHSLASILGPYLQFVNDMNERVEFIFIWIGLSVISKRSHNSTCQTNDTLK